MIKRAIFCVGMLAFFLIHTYGVDSDPFCIGGLGPNTPLGHKGNYDVYVKGDDIALVKRPLERGENAIYDVIKKDDIRRDEYGFPVATFFGRDTHFLLGGNYVVFRFLDEEESGMVFLPSTCRFLVEGGSNDIYPEVEGYGGIWDIYPSGIEVSCPSYLVEGSKRYTASNVTKTFIGFLKDGGMIFNTMALPWSEGEDGPGIGVTLSIQFMPGSLITDVLQMREGDSDTIVIMNGYVDFYRPDLFLKNNRVKKVRITSTDGGSYFEHEYELKDVPEFQVIHLPRKVRSVDMTIEDVYKGSRYDDTVITAILPLGINTTNTSGTLDKLYTNPYYVNWRELPK